MKALLLFMAIGFLAALSLGCRGTAVVAGCSVYGIGSFDYNRCLSERGAAEKQAADANKSAEQVARDRRSLEADVAKRKADCYSRGETWTTTQNYAYNPDDPNAGLISGYCSDDVPATVERTDEEKEAYAWYSRLRESNRFKSTFVKSGYEHVFLEAGWCPDYGSTKGFQRALKFEVSTDENGAHRLQVTGLGSPLTMFMYDLVQVENLIFDLMPLEFTVVEGFTKGSDRFRRVRLHYDGRSVYTTDVDGVEERWGRC